MRLAAVALILMFASPLVAAAQKRHADDYGMRILTAPNSGDERAFRTTFHQGAQGRSDALFAALQKVLGGDRPSLNFVDTVNDPEGIAHLSATPAMNRINIDPVATWGLIADAARTHNGAVNQIPHEMMHLRQTPQVLASVPDREGGAQAFANLVTSTAAAQARIPYTTGNFDGGYAPYVDAAKKRGIEWLLGGQMGKPPVSWP